MKASGCDLAALGARMRTAREALSLSQARLAEENGYSVRTYQKNEGGLNEPGICLAAAFMRAGINANWLLTGEGPMLLADARELEGLRTQLAHSVAAYDELSEVYQKKLDELCEWQLRAAHLQKERDALIAGGGQPQDVPLNQPAMRAIITGVIEGTRGRDLAPEQIAEKAVELYCRAISEDLITPTGIGKGGSQAA